MVADPQKLLTKKSLELSLSAPRLPPAGSEHRKAIVVNHGHGHGHHPHATVEEARNTWTRRIGSWIPLTAQNRFRDRGGFRTLVDGLVTYTAAPWVAASHPSAAAAWVRMTRSLADSQSSHGNNTNNCYRIVYGPHPRHYMEIYRPENANKNRRWIFFIHGGAWGSGEPWMYRLVAESLRQRGYSVALPAYRTYPDGAIDEQLQDCRQALECLMEEEVALSSNNNNNTSNNGSVSISVAGHSSGAHVGLLMLVAMAQEADANERRRQQKSTEPSSASSAAPNNTSNVLQAVDSFCGISGPYNIADHFDYEAHRGVEEISPMKAANGHTRQAFAHNSPGPRLLRGLAAATAATKSSATTTTEPISTTATSFPQHVLLMHGMEDDTVPFTATSDMAKILRSTALANDCREVYLPRVGHEEAVLQCMVGGPAQEHLADWLRQLDNDDILDDDDDNRLIPSTASSPPPKLPKALLAAASKL